MRFARKGLPASHLLINKMSLLVSRNINLAFKEDFLHLSCSIDVKIALQDLPLSVSVRLAHRLGTRGEDL